MRDEHFTRLLGSLSQLSEEQVDTLLSAAQAHRYRSACTKVLDTLQAEHEKELLELQSAYPDTTPGTD
jgi:hypothetical protein